MKVIFKELKMESKQNLNNNNDNKKKTMPITIWNQTKPRHSKKLATEEEATAAANPSWVFDRKHWIVDVFDSFFFFSPPQFLCFTLLYFDSFLYLSICCFSWYVNMFWSSFVSSMHHYLLSAIWIPSTIHYHHYYY